MKEIENEQPSGPDMTRVDNELFRFYGAMAGVLFELSPGETTKLGPFDCNQMASAHTQLLNGRVEPGMLPHLERASRLRQLFDRQVPLVKTESIIVVEVRDGVV